jgi:selenocysteine lyase/cysteine desulfurase
VRWTGSEFLQGLESASAEFLRDWPAFRSTAILDDLRASEYGRLDRERHVYLDYTGGGLYAAFQVERHHELLLREVFGNPHSSNPTSLAMTRLVERARAAVLGFFGASPDEYLAVFTPNASGALRLVGEAYPFAPGGRFLLTFDNHNSVNGIREFARRAGAAITYLPVHRPAMRLDRAAVSAALAAPAGPRGVAPRLFAFPAQSNFTGVQHPLGLVEEAHAQGWDVLLDAAAFAPTNRLDLSRVAPDFVSLSFYKMFGYPTGVGALLIRREMLERLKRPWFAGGTILIASVQGDGHYLAPDAAAYEDGTVDYLSLPAVEIGLRHLETIGMERIHERVRCLTGWVLRALGELRHANGRPLVRVHGPADGTQRGGTVAFSLLDPAGVVHDIRRIEELGNESRISLRTGCFCNPGAGEVACGLSPEEIAAYFGLAEGLTFDELRVRVRERTGKAIGAVRVSFGLASSFADAYRFLDFLRAFADRTASEVGAVDMVAGRVGWMRDSA